MKHEEADFAFFKYDVQFIKVAVLFSSTINNKLCMAYENTFCQPLLYAHSCTKCGSD